MMASFRTFASRTPVVHALRIVVIVLVIAAAVVLSAILQGDVPDSPRLSFLRPFFHRYSYLASYALLYIEESGVPLPAPGDVFVMYVGAHVPANLFSWIAAWLGLIAVVVAGATNLFFISRKFGRQLAHSRVAEVVHLSPERLAKAEKWFDKYGVVAIIFGRHIPGFRVPITVAAGVLKVKYSVFAASVAASTAIWAGIVITIGINFGPRMGAFLRVHREMYWLWAAVVLAMIILIVYRARRKTSGASLPTSADR
ncbi:MAG TPA: DedA family protein [Candidatus Nitrosotalea sp.]|nr:DedA family protein [Candidatus Nitrosotalea sp.]